MASTTHSAQSAQPSSASIWTRIKPLLRWPWELIPLIALFGWLYRQTMPPGVSSWIVEGWDSAMLQVTGSTWGIPHSPGYPLYTILSNIFVRVTGLIPGLSDTSVVWRVTFWSTFTSLLTLAFVYLIVRKITRNRTGAIIAAGLLGISFIFWRGAIMAEVYSLNALIFALTYWLAIQWHKDPRDRWLIIMGLVVGAGLAHHRTAFILPPTIALWVALKRPEDNTKATYCKRIIRSWLILAGTALIPLLSYLYLPWAAQNRAGQTWLYADTSDWNTFWFVVLTREWWGLVDTPTSLSEWFESLQTLFRQQADQITAIGVIAGIIGLVAGKRYLWLFGPPLLAFIFFGTSYRVADVDSMLIPLTLILCVGVGILIAVIYKYVVFQLVRLLRTRDEIFRNKGMVNTVRITVSLVLLIGSYFLFRPLAEWSYQGVDLSGDWQAEDLVEEVVAIAEGGTPLTIIGQDNSVLPDFIYAAVVLEQPVEPLSTTGLSRMPEEASIQLLKDRFERGNRILVDIQTIDFGFIPWLNEAIESGQIFLAPTGHPFLWELLPRPMGNVLPQNEDWQQVPPEQFIDGQMSIIAYNQQIVQKRTGCFLRLSLFWRAEEYIEDDYYIAVQPLGGDVVVDKNDHLALMRGYLPTSKVRPGEIVRDEVDLLIRQPAALPGVMLVTNLYQVQGDQFPTFGEVTLPITVDPAECK
jgi:4-amino-4-deoxy-L-arabinose transferase-like glycosyltransferase